MATSQTRARSGKAATPKAAKAVTSSRPVAKKKAVAKTAAVRKSTVAERAVRQPAAKSVAKKAASGTRAGQATAAPKRAPRTATTTGRGKAVAKAGPAKAAPRKARATVTKALDAYARLRKLVLDALANLKANEVVEVDVRGKSSVADLLVVASGTSSRHVKSIADEVIRNAKQAGNPPIGVEGQREGEWVLVDLGDVIVHVMLPRTREFYGLERLWSVGDAEGMSAA